MTVIETKLLPRERGAPESIETNKCQKVTKETMLPHSNFDEVYTYFNVKQIPTTFKKLTDVLQSEQEITAQQVECYFQGKIREISELKKDLKQRIKDYIDARMKVTNRANYSTQAKKIEEGVEVAEIYFFKYQKCDAQACLNKRIDSLITLITYKLNQVKQEVLLEKFRKQDQYVCVESQDLQTPLELLRAFPNGRKNKRVSTEHPPSPKLAKVVDAIYQSMLSDLYEDSLGAFDSGHLDRSPPVSEQSEDVGPKELDSGYTEDIEEELGNHTDLGGSGGSNSIDPEAIMAALRALEDSKSETSEEESYHFLLCSEGLEK